MRVTFAQIQTAYAAINGTVLPSDMPYVKAAQDMVAKFGYARMVRFMKEVAIALMDGARYEDAAAALVRRGVVPR